MIEQGNRYKIEFIYKRDYDKISNPFQKNGYTPIPVAELVQKGYESSVQNGEEIVYLTPTGYKNYMSAQYDLSGSIDNTMPSYPHNDIKYPKRHGR